MIYFKSIRWKNFLSSGNAFTEIRLDQHTTTLIVGENGAGKSTFLDALCFVLYGKPFRKINKPQLLNSINKKELLVEIDFKIGPATYKIVRGMKPNVFEVYQNGKLLNQNAETADYQDVLENQILKLNHKSFCQVVVLGSAAFVPFMQLTAANRREVIEDLLDIQIFSKMNSILKDDIAANNKALMKAEYDYNLTSEKINMQQELLTAMQKNVGEQIEKLRKELGQTNDEIALAAQRGVDLEEAYSVCVAELEEMNEQKVQGKKHKLMILEQQMNDKIKKLEHEIEFFDKNDDCPTCKQVIDTEFKCETVADKNNQIQETSEGIVQLKDEVKKVEEKIREIEEVKLKKSSLGVDISAAQNQYKGLRATAKKICNEIKELQEKSDSYTINDDKMKTLEADLQMYLEAKSECQKQKDALSIAAIVLKDGGIKARIIKQYVPVINKLINKYLSAMDFFVNFELDENFNETIKSRHRDEFSYNSFSEGEKMRINLAILFTWRAVAKMRNSASTNILIMDEVLDGSLDVNGTNEFLKILNELTKDSNTFIISHKSDQMIDKFSNVLRFEKHKNFSRLVG